MGEAEGLRDGVTQSQVLPSERISNTQKDFETLPSRFRGRGERPREERDRNRDREAETHTKRERNLWREEALERW